MATWIPTKGNDIPKNAFQAGYEDGSPLYIARARMVDGINSPGKCGPHLKGAHFPYGGKEVIIEHHYEVFVPAPKEEYAFKLYFKDGDVPPNAVNTDDGIYVGRFVKDEGLIPGKIAPLHNSGYVGYDGKEFIKKAYEVLARIK